MSNFVSRVEGWKTKDGRFHETREMARVHAFRYALSSLCIGDSKEKFKPVEIENICNASQDLFDLMTDIGFESSPKAVLHE